MDANLKVGKWRAEVFKIRRKLAVADTESQCVFYPFLTRLLIEDKKNASSSNKIKRSRDRKSMAVSHRGVLWYMNVYFSCLPASLAWDTLDTFLLTPSLCTCSSLAWGTAIQHLWFHQSNSSLCPSFSRNLPLTFQSWLKCSSQTCQ